jgi:hypothetical protein
MFDDDEELYVYFSVMDTEDLLAVDTTVFTIFEFETFLEAMQDRRDEINMMVGQLNSELEDKKKNTRTVTLPADLLIRLRAYLTDSKPVID